MRAAAVLHFPADPPPSPLGPSRRGAARRAGPDEDLHLCAQAPREQQRDREERPRLRHVLQSRGGGARLQAARGRHHEVLGQQQLPPRPRVP